jgi:hypothetical protein
MPNNSSCLRRLALACRPAAILSCFLVLAVPSLHAQLQNVDNIVQTPTRGSGHDYIKMISETVNPANGQVSIRIDVPMPPGRKLTLPFGFAYDSGSVFHVGPSLVAGSAQWWTNRRWMR